MKTSFSRIAICVLMVGACHAAHLSVTNMLPLSGGGYQLAAVLNSSGERIPDGSGFIGIAALTLADTQIRDAAGSLVGFVSLLNDFEKNALGPSSAFGGLGAFDTDGIYNFEFSTRAIDESSPFVGRAVFTVIGDGETLRSSSQVAVFKHSSLLEADLPFFATDANLAGDSDGELLVGTGGLSGIEIDGGSYGGVMLVPLGVGVPVPEPSSALLITFTIAAILVRRRS